MGAAPAEDSHLRIAEVAACIRALLSIVNRYIEDPCAACIATGTLAVDLRCHPNLQDADPGEMKMYTIVKSRDLSHILDVHPSHRVRATPVPWA